MISFNPSAATPQLLLMGVVATVALHQVQKPFTPDALGHRVRAALDRPRAL